MAGAAQGRVQGGDGGGGGGDGGGDEEGHGGHQAPAPPGRQGAGWLTGEYFNLFSVKLI